MFSSQISIFIVAYFWTWQHISSCSFHFINSFIFFTIKVSEAPSSYFKRSLYFHIFVPNFLFIVINVTKQASFDEIYA